MVNTTKRPSMHTYIIRPSAVALQDLLVEHLDARLQTVLELQMHLTSGVQCFN